MYELGKRVVLLPRRAATTSPAPPATARTASASACRTCPTSPRTRATASASRAWPAYRVSQRRAVEHAAAPERLLPPAALPVSRATRSDVTIALGVYMGVNAKGAESDRARPSSAEPTETTMNRQDHSIAAAPARRGRRRRLRHRRRRRHELDAQAHADDEGLVPRPGHRQGRPPEPGPRRSEACSARQAAAPRRWPSRSRPRPWPAIKWPAGRPATSATGARARSSRRTAAA